MLRWFEVRKREAGLIVWGLSQGGVDWGTRAVVLTASSGRKFACGLMKLPLAEVMLSDAASLHGGMILKDHASTTSTT